MPITEKHKEAMYRWREKNRDKYREICRNGFKKYYENDENKAKKIKSVSKNYFYKKECKIFRNILLEN